MTYSVFHNAKIKGISCVIPPKEVSLLDDNTLYDGDSKKLERVINSSGFLKRRIAASDVMTSDMCVQAALDSIGHLRVKKETIDGLLFLSYTPDYLMPATSYILHHKLGLSSNCVVMDIPQACSGYEIGLFQASMLLNAGYKRILLLVGDCFSKFSDMFDNHTAPVFGDAGTATLIDYDETSAPSYYNIYSDGSGYDALICPNGGFRTPPTADKFYKDGRFQYCSHMHGGRIFDFTLQKIAPSITELLDCAHCVEEDINYFVMHQANKFILQNIADILNIPEYKIPMTTLTKYGNQCGASVPCTISDNLQRQVSSEHLKVMLSGFGVGLSWANAIVELDKIYCSPLINYKG